MELIDKLKELQKNDTFTADEILKITSVEELFFIIIEAIQTGRKNYNSLFPAFEELRVASIEEGGLNVFTEYLSLKFYFLSSVYEIDRTVLDALMTLLGPVVLDFELEERFFGEDAFAKFYFKRYQDFKSNNELSMIKIMSSLDANQLKVEGEEFSKQLEDLKVALGLK